jgi:hypothetical protein
MISVVNSDDLSVYKSALCVLWQYLFFRVPIRRLVHKSLRQKINWDKFGLLEAEGRQVESHMIDSFIELLAVARSILLLQITRLLVGD